MNRRIVMSKKMMVIVSVLVIVVMAAGCGSRRGSSGVKPQQGNQQNTESRQAEQTDSGNQSGTATQSATLSEEEAKKIALEDAGVTENDISHIRVKLDRDDGILEYEVEFYAGNQEYDYSIDASTGEIRSKDMEIENDFNRGNTQNGSDSANSGNSQSIVSETDAKNTALARVEGATEQNIRIHLDWDDGRQVYEGSIYHAEREYEFEIDASTGEIISWEEESIYD